MSATLRRPAAQRCLLAFAGRPIGDLTALSKIKAKAELGVEMGTLLAPSSLAHCFRIKGGRYAICTEPYFRWGVHRNTPPHACHRSRDSRWLRLPATYQLPDRALRTPRGTCILRGDLDRPGKGRL